MASINPGRGNVSVTNINCQQNNADQNVVEAGTTCSNNGSIRISVPKMEEFEEETELVTIENMSTHQVEVNMRDQEKQNHPRPMSWEGELSGNEEGTMDVEIVSNIIKDESQSVNESIDLSGSMKESIHFCDSNASVSTAVVPTKIEIDAAMPTNTIKMNHYFNNSNKKLPDLSAVKYELGTVSESLINSPLLVRSKSNLLPTNPSPDSAIHSLYTHSSPSQSPLTSRHAAYGTSLSRNNSDASYSSC